MFQLEKSIKSWLSNLYQQRSFDEGAIREMELHLRDHIEDLVSEGYTEKEAFDIAVVEFGDIPAVAKEEFTNIKVKTTLRSIIYTHMFKNYFKTTVRAFMKYPLSSFINLIGLSVAIGICMLSYAFYCYVYDIDQFHKHKNKVFLTTFYVDRDGTMQEYGLTPTPIGDALMNDISQVKKRCRINKASVVVKYDDDKVFYERVKIVDEEFLEMFTFPLKWGNPSSLQKPNHVILSEETSQKYFDDQNPVGQTLKITFKNGESRNYEISGVSEKIPESSSIGFTFLINFDNNELAEPDNHLNDWGSFISATFIQLKNAEDAEAVTEQMARYIEQQNAMADNWKASAFSLQPFKTLYKKSASIKFNILGSGYFMFYSSFITFSLIGFFVIVLAASNYINIAIVSASKRLKEIGLRKVIGASRQMIIVQFMLENVFMMAVALVIGVLMGTGLFIPWLEETMGFNLGFTLYDPKLWAFLPAILLFTALISGLYPAVYVSKFQIAAIFKGSFKISRKGFLTKLFLGFQIMLACIIISVAVLFMQNSYYQSGRSWGYNKDQVVYAHIHDYSYFKKLKAVMEQNPDVLSISGSKHHLGRISASVNISLPERKYEVSMIGVDHEYLRTMGISIKEGSGFQNNVSSTHNRDGKSVLVNETMVANLGLENPIGEVFKIDENRYYISGVVHDFHLTSFSNDVKPTFLVVGNPKNYEFISLKVKPGAELKVREDLRNAWSDLFPEIPFDGGLQVETWGRYFESLTAGSNIWGTLAVIVLILAGLGLYGLVAINISGRSKEFSIRKVLGASLQHVSSIILRQYLAVFAIALLLGCLISYEVTETIFKTFYRYHMPMNYSFFIFSGSIMVLVILAIIGIQIKRVSESSAVNGLKAE
ncbi:MAG: FtsX-like permease family protein [Bacteroidota bacterium]